MIAQTYCDNGMTAMHWLFSLHDMNDIDNTEDEQDEIRVRVRKHFSVRELDCELSLFSFGK